MRILFIGDVFGKPGRRALREKLPDIKQGKGIDFCIVNAENSASGRGITPGIADSLFECGADCITLGNHAWDRADFFTIADEEDRIIRPYNWPPGVPGFGYGEFDTQDGVTVSVCQFQGRVYLPPVDCPFRAFDDMMERFQPKGLVIVDFHAEATSEKIAFGWHVDGRATAVIGTHTHVPTADECVLPNGTGYITDSGMTGPHDSVIGVDKNIILKRFKDLLPSRNEVAENDVKIRGVIVDADPDTNHATSMQRFVVSLPDRD